MVEKTIAFFSNRDELDFLKDRQDFKKLKLIAITPEADFYADELGVEHTTIEDYYDEQKLNIEGNSAFQKVKKICDEMDYHFIKLNSFFSCSDIYNFIKTLYDQLLINHAFCIGIFKKEAPDKVFLFNIKEVSPLIDAKNDDLIISFIQYFFLEKKIPCEAFLYSHPGNPKKYNLSKNLKLFSSNLKFNLISGIKRFIRRKKISILILQHYDFESCKTLQDYFRVYWLKALRFKKKNELPKCPGEDYSFLNSFFTFDGVCYMDLVKPKIYYVQHIVSKDFDLFYKKISSFLIKKGIKIAIAASGQSLEILAGIKAAYFQKIPVIWGQHGGLYGYGEFPLMNYLHSYYTHYFLYTQEISIINAGKNCYPVLNSTLIDLYYAKRK